MATKGESMEFLKKVTERVKAVDYKKLGSDVAEITVGTVGFVGVGIVEGGLGTVKYTIEGTKKSVEKSKELGSVIKEKCSDVDVAKYKEKVKGFTSKGEKQLELDV